MIAACLSLVLLVAGAPGPGAPDSGPPSAREALLDRMQAAHDLDEEAMRRTREVLAGSRWIGQGNPEISRPAMDEATCRERWEAAEETIDAARWEAICGRPLMAPLYDPTREEPEAATACIDRLEYPGVPCLRPVVWVRASEAAALCEAIGKRLCDAHEWEGACAGRLLAPDYRWDLAAGRSPADAVAAMRRVHNPTVEPVWATGDAPVPGQCAAGSAKSAGCDGGGWSACGSNTYPAGAFPECRSPLGVDDLHGNAAEHMNLPLAPDQMASRGSASLGVTEMKGSWFLWDSYRAHEDRCRWRAPYWHGTRVRSPDSHHNYHLGLRCCADVGAPGPSSEDPSVSAPAPPPGGAPGLRGTDPRR